jgi:hypothetical protein
MQGVVEARQCWGLPCKHDKLSSFGQAEDDTGEQFARSAASSSPISDSVTATSGDILQNLRTLMVKNGQYTGEEYREDRAGPRTCERLQGLLKPQAPKEIVGRRSWGVLSDVLGRCNYASSSRSSRGLFGTGDAQLMLRLLAFRSGPSIAPQVAYLFVVEALDFALSLYISQ